MSARKQAGLGCVLALAIAGCAGARCSDARHATTTHASTTTQRASDGRAPAPAPNSPAAAAPDASAHVSTSPSAQAGASASTDAGAPGAVPRALLQTTGDLDRTGRTAAITLYDDGTITVDGWAGHVEMPAGLPPEAARAGALRVVDIDRRERGVLVVLPTEGDEDPPNRFQLLVPTGDRLRTVFDEVIGTYGSPELVFRGDGLLRYVEDGHTACGRAPRGTIRAVVHEVRYRLGNDGDMHEIARVPIGRVQDCTQLAACPYVDLVDPAGAVTRVGEILRNVRGEAAYTLQSLGLPAAARGPLHVRLAEEKDEVTFLDELYLEVDGARLTPRACAAAYADAAAPPSYCAADRRMHRLQRGETLDVVFELPTASAHPQLFARGYYVPVSDARATAARVAR